MVGDIVAFLVEVHASAARTVHIDGKRGCPCHADASGGRVWQFRCTLEERGEQLGEEVRPHAVGSNLQLILLGRQTARRGCHDACIVGQDIKPAFSPRKVLDGCFDGREVGKVELEELQAPSTIRELLLDPTDCGVGFSFAASGEIDSTVTLIQDLAELTTTANVAASNYEDAARLVREILLRECWFGDEEGLVPESGELGHRVDRARKREVYLNLPDYDYASRMLLWSVWVRRRVQEEIGGASANGRGRGYRRWYI